jgi:hypothetical protein
LRRWLACCGGCTGGRAAAIVGGVGGRGGEGTQSKGPAGEKALRVHLARGRFQTGARRGSVGEHRRDAAASHRMVSCNTRGRSWEPTTPRRPATGHSPGHWQAKGCTDSYCARASGDPLCRGRGGEPPPVFRLMVASDGRRRPCLPGSVPTGYASQHARGMASVRGARLLVRGSVSWRWVLPVARAIPTALVPGWCSSRAAGWLMCVALLVRGPPGVHLPGILPAPLGARGGGPLGGCAAWVPHHFCCRRRSVGAVGGRGATEGRTTPSQLALLQASWVFALLLVCPAARGAAG